MKNLINIQILAVFLLVCEIQGFDPDYTETCKCRCNGEVCKWDQYCDRSTNKCEYCKERYDDCFTPARKPCCESFCKTVQPCPVLKSPEHGRYGESNGQKINHGTTLEVLCSNGYYNTGVTYTTCRSGRWSHLEPNVSQPFCKQIVCKSPSVPTNGGIRFRPGLECFVIGTKIIDTCNDGFYLKGDAERHCLSNGSWSFHSATCVAKEPSTDGSKAEPMLIVCFVFVLYRICLELHKWFSMLRKYWKENRKIPEKHDIEQPETENQLLDDTNNIHSLRGTTDNGQDGFIDLRAERSYRWNLNI